MRNKDKIILALPKGRILEDTLPILKKVGIQPEDSFFDKKCRELSFSTNIDNLDIIRVRSFDVATFVSYGAADIAVAGSDVVKEFNYQNIYTPVDLGIGKCHLALAAPIGYICNKDDDFWNNSHIRVATKYVNLTKRFFADRGIQAECIKLNGAIELAPKLNLCERIVDLVSSGATLKANGLSEVENLLEVSSMLIVNRGAFKTKTDEIENLIEKFSIYSRLGSVVCTTKK